MLITQYAAAKQAGVSKQTIFKQKCKLPRPLYFVNVMEQGKEVVKVDDDHQLWKLYIKNVASDTSKEAKDNMKFNKLLAAVVDSIKEKYNPGAEEMTELLSDIDRRFRSE